MIGKRVRSQSFEDNEINNDNRSSSVVSKIAKIKDSIFSIFGQKNNQQNYPIQQQQQQQQHVNRPSSLPKSSDVIPDRQSTPVFAPGDDFSFQYSNGPITARQLEAYYNALKKENEFLSNSMNDSIANNSVIENNAESTNIVDDENSLNKSDKNSVANENDNAIVVFNNDENLNSNISSNSNIDDLMIIDDAEKLGLTPLFSQTDPLERANLVQLKKMMELEKYRRYRLSYIKKHTSHINNSSAKKVGKSVNDKLKYSKYNKKVDFKNLPADRRNKSGVFGISLLDTVPDDTDDVKVDEKVDDIVKPVDSNPVSKLRFNDNSKTATFELSSKTRSFIPKPETEKESPLKKDLPKEEIKIPTKTSISSNLTKVAEPAAIPSSGFKFEAAKPDVKKSEEKKPTSSFSFGFSKPTEPSASKSDTTSTTPSFSFGQQKEETDKPATTTPSFSFGQSKSVPSKPLFGAKSSLIEEVVDADALNDPSMDVKSKALQPSGFKFGVSTDKSSSETLTGTKLPALFGTTKPSDLTTNADTKPTTPSFLFGKMESTKPTSSFSFGNNATADKLTVPKTNLPSFGVSNTDKKESEKDDKVPTFGANKENSSFSFGGFGSTDSAAKPQIAEKTEGTTMPTLNFGDNSKPSTTFKPAEAPKPTSFSFGNTTATETTTKSEEKKATPAFNFGIGSANSTKPEENKISGITFGQTATTNSTTKPEENKISGITFGQSTSTNLTTKPEETKSTPSFSFGNASTPSTAVKPVSFGFGSSSTPGATKPAESKPASNFNFGANTPVSSLNFGMKTDKPKDDPDTIEPSAKRNNTAFGFGGAKSTATTTLPGFNNIANGATNGSTFNFASNKPSTTQINGALSANANNANGGTPSSFNFGSGSNTSSTTNMFGQSKPLGSGSQPNNVPATSTTPGKMFSFNTTAFPPLTAAPNAGLSQSQSPVGTSGFNFGATNSNSNIANTGFGATPNGFGGMNNSNSNGNMFGGINTANNNMFGNNSNGNGMNNASTTFNFGGASMPNSQSTTRSGTPNINFSGQAIANVDPSTIFGQQQATPEQMLNRPRAVPRRRRQR